MCVYVYTQLQVYIYTRAREKVLLFSPLFLAAAAAAKCMYGFDDMTSEALSVRDENKRERGRRAARLDGRGIRVYTSLYSTCTRGSH